MGILETERFYEYEELIKHSGLEHSVSALFLLKKEARQLERITDLNNNIIDFFIIHFLIITQDTVVPVQIIRDETITNIRCHFSFFRVADLAVDICIIIVFIVPEIV